MLNRGVARLTLFENPEDYDAFLHVLETVWEEISLPIFALAVMPNIGTSWCVRTRTIKSVRSFAG